MLIAKSEKKHYLCTQQYKALIRYTVLKLIQLMKFLRNIFISGALLIMSGAMTAIAAPAENAQTRIETAAIPVVKVMNGHVEIHLSGEESRQVLVYALTGQLVKSVTATPGVTVIDLPSGYYIVKCDRQSQRVIVR